jgi:bacterial/archaeal transporter family-2 protein
MNLWNLAGIVLAVVIGAFLPLQALINAQLGRITVGPLFASFVSFLVGTVTLGAVILALRTPVPGAAMLGNVAAWVWAGGALGAVYVVGATLLVPRLGATALTCLIVLGQVVASLLLDHYGVLASPRPADLARVSGVALVLAGVVLVVQPWQGR